MRTNAPGDILDVALNLGQSFECKPIVAAVEPGQMFRHDREGTIDCTDSDGSIRKQISPHDKARARPGEEVAGHLLLTPAERIHDTKRVQVELHAQGPLVIAPLVEVRDHSQAEKTHRLATSQQGA